MACGAVSGAGDRSRRLSILRSWRQRLCRCGAGQGRSQSNAIDLGPGHADRRLGRRAHRVEGQSGIDITLNYINEVFAVLSGGLQRRASYEGRLEFSVDTDLQKLIGWNGASTHFTVYQIHNSGHNAADNVGSASPIPATSTRCRPRGCSPPGSSRMPSTTVSRCASASSPPTMNSSSARPPAA